MVVHLKRFSAQSRALVAAVLFIAATALFTVQSFAATGPATLYTSPNGTQSVNINSNFTISVRIATGNNVPVSAATIYLAYPGDKVQVVSASYAGSAYNVELVESDSGSVFRMDRAALPEISGGDKLFAQITFKAIANGSAALSFTSDSRVHSGEDDSNILAARNGVTYNISTPPPGPSPQPPSPNPSPPPPGSTTPRPPSVRPNPSPPTSPGTNNNTTPNTTTVTPESTPETSLDTSTDDSQSTSSKDKDDFESSSSSESDGTSKNQKIMLKGLAITFAILGILAAILLGSKLYKVLSKVRRATPTPIAPVPVPAAVVAPAGKLPASEADLTIEQIEQRHRQKKLPNSSLPPGAVIGPSGVVTPVSSGPEKSRDSSIHYPGA